MMKKEWCKGSIGDKYVLACLAGGVVTLGSWSVHEASKTLTKVCSVHKIIPISALPVLEAFEKMTLTCFEVSGGITIVMAIPGLLFTFAWIQFASGIVNSRSCCSSR